MNEGDDEMGDEDTIGERREGLFALRLVGKGWRVRVEGKGIGSSSCEEDLNSLAVHLIKLRCCNSCKQSPNAIGQC